MALRAQPTLYKVLVVSANTSLICARHVPVHGRPMTILPTKKPKLLVLLLMKNLRNKFAICLVALLSACGGQQAPMPPNQLPNQLHATVSAYDYDTVVQQLYIAYFGRPADLGGLTNFKNRLAELNAPTSIQQLGGAYKTNPAIKELVDSFSSSTESAALYAGDTTAFITAIYMNVLSRAPDASGLAYWVGEIDKNGLNRSLAAISIMAGALTNSSAQGRQDGALVAIKVDASKAFVQSIINLGKNGYAGDAAAGAARAMLASLGPDTTPSNYNTAANQLAAGLASTLPLENTGTISLIAGNIGGSGTIDGMGTAARLHGPKGIVVDGSNLYFSDKDNNTIRKLAADGRVTTVAGAVLAYSWVDSVGNNSRFYYPGAMAIDKAGTIYILDNKNAAVRKMAPNGTVTTLVGAPRDSVAYAGLSDAARFEYPEGIAIDGNGNVFIGDGSAIVKITPGGVASIYAGVRFQPGSNDGALSVARFGSIGALAIDAEGNLYASDVTNYKIRKISSAGVVSTFAGTGKRGSTDGDRSVSTINGPRALAFDRAGNLYFGDSESNTIRMISVTGQVSTIAGTAGSYGSADGVGASARFHYISGITFDEQGNLYVADYHNDLIRKITPDRTVTTVAGTRGFNAPEDTASTTLFDYWTSSLVIDNSGNTFVADRYSIRKVSASGEITTFVGLPDKEGTADGTGNVARFTYITALAADKSGNLYAADFSTVRMITAAGKVTTIAGRPGRNGFTYDEPAVDGPGNIARFKHISALAVDGNNNIYAADSRVDTIRKISPDFVVSTVAGKSGSTGSVDGPAGKASLSFVYGLVVGADNNLFVTEYCSVRKISPAGSITTITGNATCGFTDGKGTAAQFDRLTGLAIDRQGNLYVSDHRNSAVRKITSDGQVTTVAGRKHAIGVALGALPGSLSFPGKLVVNPAGAILVLTEPDMYYYNNGIALLKLELP